MRDDETQLRREMDEGLQARQILDSPIFRKAIEQVSEKALRDIKNAKPEQERALLVAKLKYDLVTEVIRELKTVLDTGKMAQKRWETLTDAFKRKRAA